MYGRVVSSNGEIEFSEGQTYQQIELENSIEYFRIETSTPFYLYLNDDTDKILIRNDTVFETDRFPVYRFKVERYSIDDPYFKFSYYGFY